MTAIEDRTVDAVSITRLSAAYAQSKILHSAVEIGLFDLLAEGPAGEQEIVSRLGLHPRFTRDFLNAATALDLLERDGERYRNSPSAAAFLVPGGPVYLGGRIKTASQRHYYAWGKLTDALRAGEPQNGGGPGAFDDLYADPAKARGFLTHMDANNALVAPQLAECVDWAPYRSFVDVGGARGNVAAQLVKAFPHLTGGVYELPPVEPFFTELMAELGTADSVRFHAGDFFTDPLPETDVLLFGHVLHDWSDEKRLELLTRAAAALKPGGAVVIYDQMLDDHDPDLPSLIGSLNVGLMTGGSEYTVAECKTWIEAAGLRFGSAIRLRHGNDTVVVAHKGYL